MQSTRSLTLKLTLILTLTLFLPVPTFAGGGGGEGKQATGVFAVSPEMMDLLTTWSSPATSVETLLVEQYPEVVEQYALRVAALYQDPDLVEHFAKNYPQTYAEVTEIIAQEAGDGIALVGYLLTHGQDDYAAWQQEQVLLTNNLTLPLFLAKEHPEIPSVLELMGSTPAAGGKSLEGYIREQGGNEEEATQLLSRISAIPLPFPKPDCVCWVALTFSRAPGGSGGWQSRTTNLNSTYWDGGYRRLDFERRFRGAAREVDFRRTSKLRRHEAGRQLDGSRTAMRVRLHCTAVGIPGGVECGGQQGCTGELAARIEYGSRVHQATESRGFFPQHCTAAAPGVLVVPECRSPPEHR